MKLIIHDIIVSDLENTGTFYDAQDPCVTITIPPNNTITTNRYNISLFLSSLFSLSLLSLFILIRQEDAGTFAHWTNEYQLNITEEDLNKEVLFLS